MRRLRKRIGKAVAYHAAKFIVWCFYGGRPPR